MKPTISFASLLVVGSILFDLTSAVNLELLDAFKRHNNLMEDALLSFQDIPPHGSEFRLGERTVSLLDDDLSKVDTFTNDAVFMIDGIRYDRPASLVFTSVQDADVLITKDANGGLLSAHHTKLGIEVIHFDDSTYATIHSSQFDNEKLKYYQTEAQPRPKSNEMGKEDPVVEFDQEHRSLQIRRCQDYGGYDVIPVGIVVDSLLCEFFGGQESTSARVQSILATASTYYQKAGLCKKLQLEFLNIYCTPSSDPIQSIHQAVNSPSSLLGKFATFVKDQRLNAGAIHLLHGKQFSGTGTIGYAYVDGVCLEGYNTGVDYMAWSKGSNTPLAGIFAHETGHMLNCNHVSDSSDLMYSTILVGTKQRFKASTKAVINKTASSRQCITFVPFNR